MNSKVRVLQLAKSSGLLSDRAARDLVSRAIKAAQSLARDGAPLRDGIQNLFPSEKIKPTERSFCCLAHFINNSWSVQMANLSKGASSNGDIRVWIIYCAWPMTPTSTRIWQPKKCQAWPWRLQQQARVCLFDRRVNNMLLIHLFTQQWERMHPLRFPSACVRAYKSVIFIKNVGWTERLSFFAFFPSLFLFTPGNATNVPPCPLWAENKKTSGSLAENRAEWQMSWLKKITQPSYQRLQIKKNVSLLKW